MLTHGGYPFYKCKTIWEVNDAIDEGEVEESNPQEHGAADSGGISTETGVCDCPQCGAQGQEAKE